MRRRGKRPKILVAAPVVMASGHVGEILDSLPGLLHRVIFLGAARGGASFKSFLAASKRQRRRLAGAWRLKIRQGAMKIGDKQKEDDGERKDDEMDR